MFARLAMQDSEASHAALRVSTSTNDTVLPLSLHSLSSCGIMLGAMGGATISYSNGLMTIRGPDSDTQWHECTLCQLGVGSEGTMSKGW